MSEPFPVICGPTAGGKSALALELARQLRARGQPAEIITADAFQIYRGMDIGTAKPTADERAGVPHHLIDLVEPTERFTVDDWLAHADTLVDQLRARGTLPIVVGGTHLYVKALLEGLFDGPKPDPALRAALEAQDPAHRRAELERLDPEAAKRIHPNDVRRTIRALEVYHQTGRPISAHQQQWGPRPPGPAAPDSPGQAAPVSGRPDARLIILDWPAELINRRINARVRSMVERGLLEEVRALAQAERLGPQAREALGYKQLLPVLEGRVPFGDAVERIKIETRRFAKNQRTWLKRLATHPGARRFDASEHPPEAIAQELVQQVFTR